MQLHKIRYVENVGFFDVVSKRHSIRSYRSKAVEEFKIRRILETANSAPSAGNLQAYEIFLVTDKEKKRMLVDAAYGQEFISQAPVVLVFAANPSRSSVKYGERGKLYSIQDATIAAAYAQLCAVALGLGCVWVGAFDEKSLSNVLTLNQLKPVAIMPIGYAAESPEPTERRKLDELVHEV
ncbi:MAG: nitroreductase family protein [Nitrososphaerales archaeon]